MQIVYSILFQFCVKKYIGYTKTLTIVISCMMEIIYKFNSSLHMSMFYLNIKKGKNFIVYYVMKRFVSSSYSIPQAKNLVKALWSWISYLSYHISLQIVEIWGDSWLERRWRWETSNFCWLHLCSSLLYWPVKTKWSLSNLRK